MKGLLIVSLFVLSYFVVLIVFIGPLMGSLRQSVPMSFLLNLLSDRVRSWDVVIVFIVAFVAFWEKQRSIPSYMLSLMLVAVNYTSRWL
ncbi:MAG: hypothetical protein QW057_02490 [Candidatus Bathyarchaeia archaeon]